MKALILAAALIGVAVGQTTCNDPQFQNCAAQLANAVNVSYINLFNDYTILQNALQNLWTQNVGDMSGLVLVCNSLHLFYLCLGQSNIQYCLGPNGLIGKGLTPTQAFSMDGLILSYQYMCGAGFYTANYNNNVACLQRVTQGFNDTLRGCLSTYQVNVQNDPANACTYATQELACYQAPFRAQCAPNQNIAGWWSCETQRNWIRSQFFTCPMQCNLASSRDMDQYMLDHHKVENGVHMFKLPDTFEEDGNGKWIKAEGKWVTG